MSGPLLYHMEAPVGSKSGRQRGGGGRAHGGLSFASSWSLAQSPEAHMLPKTMLLDWMNFTEQDERKIIKKYASVP